MEIDAGYYFKSYNYSLSLCLKTINIILRKS